MARTRPKIRFSKVIEILLWLAGLGVLAENIVLLQQNRRLNETLAPQISVGTQLQMLAGIAFDGRLESTGRTGTFYTLCEDCDCGTPPEA